MLVELEAPRRRDAGLVPFGSDRVIEAHVLGERQCSVLVKIRVGDLTWVWVQGPHPVGPDGWVRAALEPPTGTPLVEPGARVNQLLVRVIRQTGPDRYAVETPTALLSGTG